MVEWVNLDMICAMFRAIFEVAISVFIVVGSIGVIYVLYNTLHGAVYDPSLPHDVLWRALFSPPH